jgi:hypothetical protein
LPGFQDYADKARLTDFTLRIDAMRTAMASAYETGDRGMLTIGAGKPGEIPAAVANVPFGTNTLNYPGFDLLLMSSQQQFGQFAAGTTRPYLVVAAQGSDNARMLRNLSEIYPDAQQAWWVPSAIMVIPLLDDGMLRAPQNAASTSSGSGPGIAGAGPGTNSPVTSGPGPSATDTGPATGTGPATTDVSAGTGSQGANSPGSNGGVAASGAMPATNIGSPAPATIPVSGIVSAIPQAAASVCIHPGNGHAWGRCRH